MMVVWSCMGKSLKEQQKRRLLLRKGEYLRTWYMLVSVRAMYVYHFEPSHVVSWLFFMPL